MQWGDQLVWEWWRGKVPNAPLHYLPSNIHMVHTAHSTDVPSPFYFCLIFRYYNTAELQCFCFVRVCIFFSNVFTVQLTSMLLISFLLVYYLPFKIYILCFSSALFVLVYYFHSTSFQ